MQHPSSVHLFHVWHIVNFLRGTDALNANLCFSCTWADLLAFCCGSLSWKISVSWFKACVSLRAADETINKNCCGSLNKELPEFCLSKMQRDSAYEPTPLILDLSLLGHSHCREHLIILNVNFIWFKWLSSTVLILSRWLQTRRQPIMTLHWYHSTLCGQQLKSVVVLSCSPVWRSQHGKKDAAAK